MPAADGVTLLAIRSQLPLVNVGMAILTVLPDIGENRLDVTLGAGYRLVQAAQRILRLIVIKFRNGADRPPRIGGVAVLARYVEVSVWTMRASRGLRAGNTRTSGERQKKN